MTVRNTTGHQAWCQFSFSVDGERFTPAGEPFRVREGRWGGARVGLFAAAPSSYTAAGHADFEFFRVAHPDP